MYEPLRSRRRPTRRRHRSHVLFIAVLAALAGFSLGVARAECPNPEAAIASPIAERFRDYLQAHFERVDDPTLSAFDRFVLIGYALGRQAPAVAGDPDRRDGFDCLLVALDQKAYWATFIRGEVGLGAGDPTGFRTIFAAAMGFYDERVAELTGYDADTVLPTVFDPPFAPERATPPSNDGAPEGPALPDADAEGRPAAPVAIGPAEVGAYRDSLLAAGLGPDVGPGGATCPLERPADFLFVDPARISSSPCWTIDGAQWCCANYRWVAVAYTDGDGWAMADLDGSPVCTYTTLWRRRWDAGEPAFGGEATCPGREGPTGWYVLNLDERLRE